MKKILIAGILSLVIIGCVVAAGCTSQSTSASSSDKQIVGTWVYNITSENKNHYNEVNPDVEPFINEMGLNLTDINQVLTVKKDGTASEFLEKKSDGSIICYSDVDITWGPNGENKYWFNFSGDMYYTNIDPIKGILSEENGTIWGVKRA